METTSFPGFSLFQELWERGCDGNPPFFKSYCFFHQVLLILGQVMRKKPKRVVRKATKHQAFFLGSENRACNEPKKIFKSSVFKRKGRQFPGLFEGVAV